MKRKKKKDPAKTKREKESENESGTLIYFHANNAESSFTKNYSRRSMVIYS